MTTSKEGRRATTIYSVAQLAGVSIATVSRVLQGTRTTSPQTRARECYFTDDGRHVVTAAKQRAVLRPHGHVMRTGAALVPDEGALTTTAWMAGTFHSQVTQGHVSRSRLLSARRSHLGLRQAQGLRVFAQTPDAPLGWTLLGEPSAWAVSLDSCRWWYAHQGGLLEVVSRAPARSHLLALTIRVRSGPPSAC